MPARTLCWAVLGAGKISKSFVKDLLIDPVTREVLEVSHKLVAVGSRSSERAQQFVDDFEDLKDQAVRVYGSYEALVADSRVDVVYIGSPHSLHHEHVKLCLLAGKHVLCEKPMTVNAKQAQDLVNLAREKKLFLMEALWTRFFPLVNSLQKVITSASIGEIQNVHADFSIKFDPDSLSPNHRLVDPQLAGGALLDLGPYAWTMLALTLLRQSISSSGHDASQKQSDVVSSGDLCATSLTTPLPIPKIKASGVMYRHPQSKSDAPKIDASTIAIVEFPTPSGGTAQGILEASMLRTTVPERAVTIYGTLGHIRVAFPTCCPREYFVTSTSSQDVGDGDVRDVDTNTPKPVEQRYAFTIPGDGLGYMWEADEVARCIFEGKLESPQMPLRETVLMMQVFDEIRQQIGLKFPEAIEKI